MQPDDRLVRRAEHLAQVVRRRRRRLRGGAAGALLVFLSLAAPVFALSADERGRIL